MQKTDELIEAVARALSEEMYGRMGLAEQAGHENNRLIARAALRAIEAQGYKIEKPDAVLCVDMDGWQEKPR
jgi:hypothetical protein